MIQNNISENIASQHNIANGDTDAVVQSLFKAIVKSAREKNFKKGRTAEGANVGS